MHILRLCSIHFYLQHWFVSGNVQCFHNWHAPLGILAIFTLIFCVSIIAIIVIYALHWMEVSYSAGWGNSWGALDYFNYTTKRWWFCLPFFPSLKSIKRPRWIRSAVTPLSDGIGKKYTIWPAVELGRRLLLVLFIVAYPGNDVSSWPALPNKMYG